MTSSLATDNISRGLKRVSFLEVDSNQIPLQLQVPRSRTIYVGTGNEVIALPKTNTVNIRSTLAAGPLTLTCTDTQNYTGRIIELHTSSTLLNNMIINYGTGLFHTSGSPTTTSSITIPAGTPPFMLVFDFYDFGDCFVGSMASSGSAVGATDCLSFPISTNALNELNSAAGQNVLWNPTGLEAVSDSSFTLNVGAPGTVQSFTATKSGRIEIAYNIFFSGNLASEFGFILSKNAVDINVCSASQGLDGHQLSRSLVIDVVVGDLLEVSSVNASGPDSGVTSFVPGNENVGRISIKYLY